MRLALASLLLVVACGGDKDAKRQTAGSDDVVANVARDPAQPTAQVGDLQLAATSVGGVLELTFTNAGVAPRSLTTHIFGDDVPNYDWLTVQLTAADGTARTLHFVGSRDESGPVSIELAPGASHVERIDLAFWARRDGAELARGTYRASVDWDNLHVALDVTI